ncbi:MAG: hypothetical protein ACLP8Y_03570 [Thermoplasmata archaeon]
MTDASARPRRKRAPRRVSKHKPPRRSTRPEHEETRHDYHCLELDLVHEAFQRRGLPFVHRLESIFREREVFEVEGLLRLSAGVLHAMAARGFSRVDHWEVRPGGWLPLPEPAHERRVEPAGHLLRALESGTWQRVADARAFAVRLSGAGDVRADVTVRRVHRERGHAITVELFGPLSERDLQGLERDLRDDLAVARLQRTGSSSG